VAAVVTEGLGACLPALRSERNLSLVSRKLEKRPIGWGLRSIGAVIALSSSLMGCTPFDLFLGGGATAGVAASEERGIDGTLSDAKIGTQISAEWAHKNSNTFIALGLSVYEGRALITGVLKTQQDVDDAIKIAWGVGGVREVINEIIIDPSGVTGTFTSDTFIVAQLKAKLLIDKEVSAVNYSVDAVRGIVYLMGVAQSQDELDRVIGYARNIRYVQKVVNHVLLKDDPRRKS
jgi:osmotically-inducible protein OsmY